MGSQRRATCPLGLYDLFDLEGKTVSQVALRYLLHKDSVCSVVIGVKSILQLEENMACLGFCLNPEDIQHLDRVSSVQFQAPYNIDCFIKLTRSRDQLRHSTMPAAVVCDNCSALTCFQSCEGWQTNYSTCHHHTRYTTVCGTETSHGGTETSHGGTESCHGGTGTKDRTSEVKQGVVDSKRTQKTGRGTDETVGFGEGGSMQSSFTTCGTTTTTGTSGIGSGCVSGGKQGDCKKTGTNKRE